MSLKYNQILIILLLLLLLLALLIYKNNIKEGFINTRNGWTDDLIQRFVKYQDTVNLNNHQYNLKVLQQQATPEEVEYLLLTNYWPWTEETKYLYIEAVSRNPIIKFDPDKALDYAMRVYNENAIRQLMAWNTKEGKFLLYGALIGKKPDEFQSKYNTDPSYSVIKCDYNYDNPVMKKKTYYSSNAYLLPHEEIIQNKNIPHTIKGFKFYDKICNPCNVFKETPEYNCPFIINTEDDNDNNISTVWQNLWNIE
jgi:hypothetical protein